MPNSTIKANLHLHNILVTNKLINYNNYMYVDVDIKEWHIIFFYKTFISCYNIIFFIILVIDTTLLNIISL